MTAQAVVVRLMPTVIVYQRHTAITFCAIKFNCAAELADTTMWRKQFSVISKSIKSADEFSRDCGDAFSWYRERMKVMW